MRRCQWQTGAVKEALNWRCQFRLLAHPFLVARRLSAKNRVLKKHMALEWNRIMGFKGKVSGNENRPDVQTKVAESTIVDGNVYLIQ